MKNLALLITFLIAFPALVFAATLHGTVYDSTTLNTLEGTIITVNSTPPQTIVANPEYAFELAPGTYLLNATFFSNGYPDLQLIEVFRIESEGTFVLDLLLSPAYEELPPEPSTDLELPSQNLTSGLTSLALFLAILAFLLLRLRRLRPAHKAKQSELQPDLQEALSILRQAGGRITQKELRARLKYSEAKVSLMLDDLENRGLIKRFKKGRGKIVILK